MRGSSFTIHYSLILLDAPRISRSRLYESKCLEARDEVPKKYTPKLTRIFYVYDWPMLIYNLAKVP